jgi:hypothetical protein
MLADEFGTSAYDLGRWSRTETVPNHSRPALNGCRKAATTAPHKAESPAKVEKLPEETEISRITLTEQAEHQLGITLAAVTTFKRQTFSFNARSQYGSMASRARVLWAAKWRFRVLSRAVANET